MRRFFLIILFFILNGTAVFAHPIHVSVCNLEFDKDELIISIKIFKDDLQLAIYHNTAKEIDPNNLTAESNMLIQDYINKTLQIRLNNKNNIELNEYRNEINEEAIWLYYRIEDIPKVKSIHVLNALLLDIYLDQTNLLIITVEK